MVETNFREQPLKAVAVVGRGPTLALILVNDRCIRRTNRVDGPMDQRVLAVGRLAILGDLLQRQLANVDRPADHPDL